MRFPQYIESNISTEQWVRIDSIEAIQQVTPGARMLRIYEFRNQDVVGALPRHIAEQVLCLEVINPYEKNNLQWLSKFSNLKMFGLHCGLKKVSDFAGLESLCQLEYLELHDFTQVKSFSDIGAHISFPEKLKVLDMIHFPRLEAFEGIETLVNLEYFQFAGVSVGSIPKVAKIKSFKPLALLSHLKVLDVTSVRVLDENVDSLLAFSSLRELNLGMHLFSQEAYARLSARYEKRIEIPPYKKVEIDLGNGTREDRYFIMGKGKRILKKGQEEQLAKEIALFEQAKAAERARISDTA